MVLLAHGFPMYWYTWRHLLPTLAEAGYRAVALDLRGYGGTDHTPRGYDPFTLAADFRTVVQALGASGATIIGSGWGGLIGWTAATFYPDVISGLVAIGTPHPIRLRKANLGDPEQRRLSRYALSFQLPRNPERRLLADDAAAVGSMLRRWAAPKSDWPDPPTERYYRRAFQYRATAHCALEYHRWALRSLVRPDGVRYANRMEQQVSCPVLQVHGLADGAVLPRTVDGSEDFVLASYQRVDLPGVGHFPQEEAPGEFADVVLRWLAEHVGPSPQPHLGTGRG